MSANLATSVLGSWRALIWPAQRSGKSIRALIFNLFIVLAFGVLVPWMRGLDFFDSFLLFAYTAIPFLFAASAITDLIGPSPRRSIPTSIMAAALHSTVIFALILAFGIATVNLGVHAGRLLHPNWSFTAALLWLALAGSLLLAACGALLTVLFSANAARNTIRTLFLLILLGILYGPKYLPPAWQAEIDQQLTTEGLARVARIAAGTAAALAVGLMLAFAKARGTRPLPDPLS